jgi:hypothetical protein
MWGSTLPIEEAYVYNGNWTLIDDCHPSGNAEIHLFREVPDGEQIVSAPAEPELPGIARKCKLEQAMSNTVIELLKVAPTNPVARAHALSQLKIPIPDEHQTFEAIKEWVEMNITPKAGRGVPSQVYPSVAGRAARPTEAFRIDAAVSERQSGTCPLGVQRFRLRLSANHGR